MEIVKLTKENFSKEINNSKRIVVDFNADWCGPCRMLAPILEDLASKRTDINFAAVNIDDEEELAETYNVSSIPCLIIFENGKAVKRSIGLKPIEELESFLGD